MRRNGVVVRVPGKVNLQLSVGPLGSDGYHELVSIFQAVSIYDDVTVRHSHTPGLHLSLAGSQIQGVPTDERNLAHQAASLMSARFGTPSDLEIILKKEIPVAGGMAGGSADAAGVLVGIDSLFELGLSHSQLEQIGSELGSDVPFSIAGGIAVGTGRGDQLTPALAQGNYHWVMALSGSGLSTPAVYRECDRLRAGHEVARPSASEALLQALRAGDAAAVGAALVNDLQPAACSLKPALRMVLDIGHEYGVLGALVSGSGPTVAFLVADEERSLDLTVALSASGIVAQVARASGPVHGARLIETL